MKPTVQNMRSVIWDLTHKWDLYIDDPDLPSPFNEWLPATDVEETFGRIVTESFPAHITEVRVIKGTQAKEIRVTFADAESRIRTWIDRWINRVALNRGRYVSTLSEYARLMLVGPIEANQDPRFLKSYWVFPDGDSTFTGSSTPDQVLYPVAFVVAGEGD